MRAILILICAGLMSVGRLALADDTNAALLVFRAIEDGADPYISRILVTPDHLRMDEGTEGVAFTLFDRQAGILYNVDDETRSVLVVDPPRIKPEPPFPLGIEESDQAAEAAPVDGVAPQSWQLTANGQLCVTVEALPGVMDEATSAVAGLYDLLAFVHGRMIPQIPAEYLDACDLARNVYAPRRAWSQGLPLRLETDRMRLELLDHEPAMTVDGGLFVVPSEYRTMDMPTPGVE